MTNLIIAVLVGVVVYFSIYHLLVWAEDRFKPKKEEKFKPKKKDPFTTRKRTQLPRRGSQRQPNRRKVVSKKIEPKVKLKVVK